MDFKIEAYDAVSSTNDLIKERIDLGEAEGLVVSAKRQNSGYGRRGNAWASPEGGLYASVLLRPNAPVSDLPSLSHVCAIAARRAIAAYLPSDLAEKVKIKWPNDIVYMGHICDDDRAQFKKMCGISVEVRHNAVCVGIGINVMRPNAEYGLADSANLDICEASGDAPDDKAVIDKDSGDEASDDKAALDKTPVKNAPMYLDDLIDAGPSFVDKVLHRLIEELGDVYEQWQENLLEDLREEYMAHFALEGFKVRIDEADERPIKCKVLGINAKGNLEVLPFGKEEVETIVAGTVRML